MIVVLDANNIIQREIPTDGDNRIYVTDSVLKEIRDEQTLKYLDLNMFNITVRNPTAEYIQTVTKKTSNSLLYLSSADIEVVALVLELTEELNDEWIGSENLNSEKIVRCFTKDNGVRNALNLFGILNDANYRDKKFKMRCYACLQIYDDHVDFCKKCGYNTVTRVSVIDTDEGEKILLKKDYKPRQKTLKTSNGIEIHSEDQREYTQLLKERERVLRSSEKIDFLE